MQTSKVGDLDFATWFQQMRKHRDDRRCVCWYRRFAACRGASPGSWVAHRTAEYMEYRWTSEPYLAQKYSVLNPSLDARGRQMQQAAIDLRAENYEAAIGSYRKLAGTGEKNELA